MPITFADHVDTNPFTDRIEELANRNNDYSFLVDHYVHADGSHSFIVTDPDSSYADPRDNDGNIATLVSTHRDYTAMDDADYGIEEARERWEWLKHNGHPYRSNRQPKASNFTEQALVNFGDREALVRRYIAIFRDDILFYQDEWTVTGQMQGDWRDGYGFVTREAYDAAGFTDEHRANYPDQDFSPAALFAQELDIYAQYFRGDVYGCIHVKRGEPVFAIGDEGGYYTGGFEADEDAVWGFLGYDDHKDITEQFTDSPVVEVLA